MKHAIRFLGLAAMLLLASIPGPARESSKNIVNFWYSIPSPYSEVMDRLIQKGEEDTTRSYTVQARNFPSNGELLKALLEDPNPPEIALVDTRWLDELIKSERIMPAEDVIMQLGEFALLAYKTDNYKPQLLMNTRDEKMWGIPAFALNYALICNKDLFGRAKLKFPTNWTTFLNAGKKLTKIQSDQWGFYLPLDPPTLGVMYQIALWQSGCSLYDPERNAFTFNNEIGLKAIQRWAELIHKYKIAPSSEPADMKKVAMFLGTTEDLLRYEMEEGLKLDAVPIPSRQSPASYLRAWSFVIFKKPGSRLFETAQFAAWISEIPQITEWVSATKFIAVNKRMIGKPEYFPIRKEHPGLNNFIKALDTSKIAPYLKGYEEVLDIIGKHISEALRCNGDLKAALDKAEAEAGRLLEK